LLDKISILEIKSQRIDSPEKLVNIRKELELLQDQARSLLTQKSIFNAYQALKKVNEELWETEDSIRLKEKNQAFDTEFVQLARTVYFQNDNRARIKRHINEITGSSLVEEKSYQEY
jgi:hypothetical protein